MECLHPDLASQPAGLQLCQAVLPVKKHLQQKGHICSAEYPAFLRQRIGQQHRLIEGRSPRNIREEHQLSITQILRCVPQLLLQHLRAVAFDKIYHLELFLWSGNQLHR